MQIQTPLPFSEAEVKEPVIGSYTDFRKYLEDFYVFKVHQHKNSFSNYNYKTFSASADIKSPNYLKLIIDGDRNLSKPTAKKFARALGLDKEGTDEFLLLVEYGQSLDPLERNRSLKKLNDYRTKRKIKSGEIADTNNENIPRWISWVLHSLVDQKNIQFSIDSLREALGNKASSDEIKKAFQHLLDSKALVLDPQTGKVKKGLVPPSLEKVTTDMIRKIQSELMYIGLESLLNEKADEREVGTLTVCLTEDEFEKVKFDLRHLRKRILKDALVAREQGPGDRVYQLNVQMFPLTKKSHSSFS